MRHLHYKQQTSLHHSCYLLLSKKPTRVATFFLWRYASAFAARASSERFKPQPFFHQAPIHLAVLQDVDLDILKILLDHGADVRLSDPEGNTAIHLAIEHRRSAMLKLLLNGAKQMKFNLDVFNYEGFTPLILACLNKSYDDAKLLLQSGADPNVKDMKSGRTALFHAAECHDGE